MPGCERFDSGFPHRVVRWPGRILLPTPPVRRRVLDLTRALEPDIVLFGASMPLALLGPVVRRRLGVPYAACTHGLEIAAARLPGGRALLRRMFRDAALVTAVSRWTADILRPFLAERHPCRSPSVRHRCRPVSAPRFRPATCCERHRLDGGGPIIACVSRLVMRKGQDQVIRALPRVAREFPGVRFLVVGNGPDGDRLRALTARLRVSDRVVFAGAADAADLPAYFRAGDVFAMPCRHRLLGLEVEALGAVFLQAAGVARPSVAGRVGGVPDAVEDGDTGLLVDGTSVEQVGGAILALLRDPERARAMGIRGADRVYACFSWESMAGRFRSALADAVATSGRTRDAVSASRRAESRAVDRLNLARHAGPGIVARPNPARVAKPSRQRVIADHAGDGVGHGERIRRRHEQALTLVAHDLPVPVDVACDDRQPRGHRLEQHDPEALAPRRGRDEEVGCSVVMRQIVIRHGAEHRDAIAQGRGQLADGVLRRTGSDDMKIQVRESPGQRLECPDGVLEPLARFQSAHEEHRLARSSRRTLHAEPIDVDAIRHDLSAGSVARDRMVAAAAWDTAMPSITRRDSRQSSRASMRYTSDESDGW